MINIQLALILGCLLGGASGVVFFLIWLQFRHQGVPAWKQARVRMLLAANLLFMVSVVTVETYRDPLVRRVRYEVGTPKSEGEATERKVQTRQVRMSIASSDLGWSLAYPVAHRFLIFTIGLFVLSFVVRSARPRDQKIVMPGKRLGAKAPRYWPAGVDRQKVLENLTELMHVENIYRDPTLNLSDLAARLNISRYYLSQLINEEMGRSYHELVNHYRCQEAQRLIVEKVNSEMTISAIGFEVGFNSKASFYRVFKEETGLSPAAFRKLHVKKS